VEVRRRGNVLRVIRLFDVDGDRAPKPLADVNDDDYALLLDVLESDPVSELRADGTHNVWLVDSETIGFLEWNRASAGLIAVLRAAIGDHSIIELSWEEIP
jgi:hypothetical protein